MFRASWAFVALAILGSFSGAEPLNREQVVEEGLPTSAVALRSEGAGAGTGAGAVESSAESKAAAEHAKRAEKAKQRPDLFVVSMGASAVGVFIALLYLSSIAAVRFASEDAKELVDYCFNVALCFFALCLVFVLYGIIQEYIMTQTYGGVYFPSSSFLVAANRLLTLFVVIFVLVAKRESFIPTGCLWTAFPACTLFVSTWCQYSSLRYVSFPTQVMFKSAKIVPTMAVGTLMNNQKFGWKDYAIAACISICVAGFSIKMEESGSDRGTQTAVIGVVMMLAFLVCDAVTSNGEKRVFNSYPEFTHTQMVWMMALFSFMYSAVAIQFEHGYGEMWAFLIANPIVWSHILILSICSTAGQFIIFYIIKKHSPVLFSIMMTVRQVFSILFSTILFGHEMPPLAVGCCIGVFVVLFGQAALKVAAKWAERNEKKDKAAKLPPTEATPLKQGKTAAEKV